MKRAKSVDCDVRACQRRTGAGRRCARHAREIDGLVVKTSTVPGAGLGLFAAGEYDGRTVAFPHGGAKGSPGRGRIVTDYSGDLISRAELNARYPDADANAEYTLAVNREMYVDARDATSCLGRFANHARGARANAVFSCDQRKKVCTLKTRRNILAGAEILVNYGPDYDIRGFC